ncbi:hypothetical protein DPMN_123249 [Dreissena polymorpha]|uniref:Uncharacterized protein n=1 Tax=Dreissena polymorpha TaxID=45954 RepID=A0A9D4GQY8_DREPO|nr:hypothetical protein DPMN_123249 [Dreissena polymorpha]
MAYVAYFLKFKPTMAPAEKVVISNIPAKSYVGKEVSCTGKSFSFLDLFKHF